MAEKTYLEAKVEALEENVAGAKVAYIQPLIGKDGQQGIKKDRGISWYTSIPKTAKNPYYKTKKEKSIKTDQ